MQRAIIEVGHLVVAAALLGALGCGGGPNGVDAARATESLNSSPKLGDFVIEAQNSVRIQAGVSIAGTGDIGARGTGSGPFLSGGTAIDLLSGVSTPTDRSIIAESLRLGAGSRTGALQVNRLVTGAGAKHGAVTPLVPLPVLPNVATVVVGTSPLTVPTGATSTVSPGRFAAVSVGTGGKLRLRSGVYEASNVTLSASSRIEALGPVQLRIAGRLATSSSAFVGPAQGEALRAQDIRIEIGGRNGSNGALNAAPKAATFGTSNDVSALVLVPNGTLELGTAFVGRGAFMGRDVDVGSGARVTFQDGISGSICTAASCNDDNPCTADSCSASGVCVRTPLPAGSSCSDGNACNGVETCGGNAVCSSGTAVVCTALDQCHRVGTCDPTTGQCSRSVAPDGASCDDGDACTQADSCRSGSCNGGTPVMCAPPDDCHAPGTCDGATGECSYLPTPGPVCPVVAGPHFYFLPPLQYYPGPTGAFDASLSPVVEVCWLPAGDCADGAIARFDMAEGTGSETLQVDPFSERYAVDWNTNDSSLIADDSYRIRVLVGGTELGHVDVVATTTGAVPASGESSKHLPITIGTTVPVAFRIERGAVHVVGSSGAVIQTEDGRVTLDIPPGAIEGELGITIQPVPSGEEDSGVGLIPGTVHTFGPDGTEFAQPVRLSIVYSPDDLPSGEDESGLVLLTDHSGGWFEASTIFVDVAAHRISGDIMGFSHAAGGTKGFLTLSPSRLEMDVGQEARLTATVRDARNNVLVRRVEWTNLNSDVVTFTEPDVVAAKSLGLSLLAATNTDDTGKPSYDSAIVVVRDPLAACNPKAEGCFGGLGPDCEGIKPVGIPIVPCTASPAGTSCGVSLGSLRHDWCCYQHHNTGYACQFGPETFDTLFCRRESFEETCRNEWYEAVCDVHSRKYRTHLFENDPVQLCGCGDGEVDGTEVCDGNDLAGRTCEDEGFVRGGTLTCASDCASFSTSSCRGFVIATNDPPGADACNLLDDDDDGQVDETSDWHVGAPNTLFNGSFIRHFATIQLSDGRVAVAGYDNSSFYAVVLSPTGQTVLGPFYGGLEAPNVNEIDLAENPAGELAIVAGTNNFSCASSGCPIKAMRVDLVQDELIEVKTLPLPYSPQHGARIAFSGGGYVVAGGSRAPNENHLTWFDPSLTTVRRDKVTSNTVSSVNLAPSFAGLAWCQSTGGTVRCGVYSPDGGVLLKPLSPVPEANASLSTNGTTSEKALWWLDGDLVLAYNLPGAQARLIRLTTGGGVVAGPIAVDTPGSYASGLDEVSGTFVARTTAPNGLHHLHRYDRQLRPVAGVNPTVVSGYDYVAAVESSEQPFLVGVRPNRIDVAPIGCEASPPTAPTATITVVIRVVGGSLQASDFTTFMQAVRPPAGMEGFPFWQSPIPGSATGVPLVVGPGAYNIAQQLFEEGPLSEYEPRFGQGCFGSIQAGEQRTCTIVECHAGENCPAPD